MATKRARRERNGSVYIDSSVIQMAATPSSAGKSRKTYRAPIVHDEAGLVKYAINASCRRGIQAIGASRSWMRSCQRSGTDIRVSFHGHGLSRTSPGSAAERGGGGSTTSGSPSNSSTRGRGGTDAGYG